MSEGSVEGTESDKGVRRKKTHAYSGCTSSVQSPCPRETVPSQVRQHGHSAEKKGEGTLSTRLVLLDGRVVRQPDVVVHVKVEHGTRFAAVLVHDKVICSGDGKRCYSNPGSRASSGQVRLTECIVLFEGLRRVSKRLGSVFGWRRNREVRSRAG